MCNTKHSHSHGGFGHGHMCGCMSRHFMTKKEKKEQITKYRDSLKKEIEAIDEYLSDNDMN